jgi:hypothetical protein
MLLARHQLAGQNHDVKVNNRSLKNVARLKYFGTTVTNTNFIREEIKRRFNWRNACYRS